jgi:hypothetical protein
VKYGSAGINHYGYKAGCSFANGMHAEAIADPAAARYLCPESANTQYVCLADYSGDGVCYSSASWDGFYQVSPV